MVTIRAKFVCDNVAQVPSQTQEEPMYMVSMHAVYSNVGENKEYWKYTPSGQLNLWSVNEKVKEAFIQGKEYYLDFTPAE